MARLVGTPDRIDTDLDGETEDQIINLGSPLEEELLDTVAALLGPWFGRVRWLPVLRDDGVVVVILGDANNTATWGIEPHLAGYRLANLLTNATLGYGLTRLCLLDRWAAALRLAGGEMDLAMAYDALSPRLRGQGLPQEGH